MESLASTEQKGINNIANRERQRELLNIRNNCEILPGVQQCYGDSMGSWGVTSCRKHGHRPPRAWGATNLDEQQSGRGSIALVQPGQCHGPTARSCPTAAHQGKAAPNLPGELMASKTGWRVSPCFLIIIGKHSHSVYLFLSRSSHWSNLTIM